MVDDVPENGKSADSGQQHSTVQRTTTTRRRIFITSRESRFLESTLNEPTHLGVQVPNPIYQVIEQWSSSNVQNNKTNNKNEVVQKALSEARRIAAQRLADGELTENVDLFGQEGVEAAIAYSLEEPRLYMELNEAVRQMAIGTAADVGESMSSDNLQAYIDVYSKLHSMEAKASPMPESITLYKGLSRRVKTRIGDTFTLSTFTSTSTNRAFAEEICGLAGTLLIFTGPLIVGLNMPPLSVFPDESEVLLFPLQTFRVQSIVKHDDQHTVITLYSQKAAALEAFIERNRFFPPDSTNYSLYNLSFQRFVNLLLRPYDLDRVGYVPPLPETLQHIDNLPAYDIIEKVHGDRDVEHRKIIIFNISAVRVKYSRKQSVYLKNIITFSENENENTASSSSKEFHCIIHEMHPANVGHLLDHIEQVDPGQIATSYVLSASPEPSDIPLVFQLMPKQYHHLLNVELLQYTDEFDRVVINQIEIATALVFVLLSFFLCLSPSQWITSVHIDPLQQVFSTAQLLFHYAKLQFPRQFQALKDKLSLNYYPLCLICGKDRQEGCPC